MKPFVGNSFTVRTGRIHLNGTSYTGRASRGSIRIGPVRQDEQLATFWRFWTQGSDVYAQSRIQSNNCKVSLHASGKWFVHLGPGRHDMCPPRPVQGSTWSHATEVRYLIAPGATRPHSLKPFKDSAPGLGIALPSDAMLCLHLFYGREGALETDETPNAPNHVRVWSRTLACGTPVALTANIMALDESSTTMLAELQTRFRITMTGTTAPGSRPPFAECQQFIRTADGYNLIVHAPLPPAAFVDA